MKFLVKKLFQQGQRRLPHAAPAPYPWEAPCSACTAGCAPATGQCLRLSFVHLARGSRAMSPAASIVLGPSWGLGGQGVSTWFQSGCLSGAGDQHAACVSAERLREIWSLSLLACSTSAPGRISLHSGGVSPHRVQCERLLWGLPLESPHFRVLPSPPLAPKVGVSVAPG